jgi:inorganic triphosphatase YgiF
MPIEDARRLHFSLSAEAAALLSRSRLVGKYRKGRSVKARHADTYFDTPRHALRKSGVELRISETGSKRFQEVHAPRGESGFGEWRVDLRGGDPGLDRLDSFPEHLARRGWDERIEPVFSTDVDRTTMRLEKSGAVMNLTIDVGRLNAEGGGGPVSEDIHEAELALVSGDTSRMIQVALELVESHDLRLWHQSLGARGYALLRPSLRPKPRKAQKVLLHRGMTVGEAFLASVEAALRHLFVNEAPTLVGHPEGIHQSRVAIRRQRAVLRAFKRSLPYGGRKAFNYEFRWFQKKLGPARDWHVFLDETIPRMIKDGVDERLVEKLRRIARDERRRTSRDAAGYLTSRRFSRLLLQFERWVTLLPQQDPAGKLERKLAPFARSVLEKTHRDLLIDNRPLARMSSVDLHALRLRGKKARYAGEFFHALYPSELTGPQLKLLSRFQDRLGEANDASVARQLLTTLKPKRLSPETIRAVNEWAGERIHTCARKDQPRWRRLQRLEPFWRTPADKS